MSFWRKSFLWCLSCLVAAPALAIWPAWADDTPLVPQTRIKLTVVQWIPTKGEYQDWQALGGEFMVSQAGTLQLPVIGTLAVGSLDSAGLAGEIAKQLQARMGLVAKPDTTVEIVEYPPVYVVGDVMRPGEYRFRNGITVLEALALSGGPLRSTASRSADEIQLVANIKSAGYEILRSKVRIARLQAEMAEAAKPDFRSVLADEADAKAAANIIAQEQILFSARANELSRQSRSLNELRNLLNAEIDVLDQKVKATDVGIKNAEKELSSVSVLVEKGIAVASRKSDLERALASFQADRLDQVTAIMRARQSITQATRDLEGLQDTHHTEVAAELQQEQAKLEQFQLKQATAQKLLVELVSSGTGTSTEADMRLTVSRAENGREREVPAAESTPLRPGDVIRVRLLRPVYAGVGLPAGEAQAAPDESLQQAAPAQGSPEQASQ